MIADGMLRKHLDSAAAGTRLVLYMTQQPCHLSSGRVENKQSTGQTSCTTKVINWQRSLEALSGRAVFPFEVRIQPDSPHALVAEWTVVNQSPSKHIGYAVQWFAMAAVLVIIGLLRLTNLRSLFSRGSRP